MDFTPDNQHDKMLELLEKLKKLENEHIESNAKGEKDNDNDT